MQRLHERALCFVHTILREKLTIVLPLTQDMAYDPPPISRSASLQSTLRVMVFGFSPAERELIQGIVALSQRRSQQLELVDNEDMSAVDVILLDGDDERTMKWVAKGGLPDGKTVIQVDGRRAPAGAIHMQRPVQWPNLPSLLRQAQDPNSPLSTRQPLSEH